MLLILAMHPHPPLAILLYSNPPYTHNELLSDVPSDFPPIEIHKSSPSPPVRSISQSCYHFLTVQEQLESSISKSAPQSSRHSRQPYEGLGHKNVHNTVEATVQDAKVRNQTLQGLILITCLSECSQILVEARPRTS